MHIKYEYAQKVCPRGGTLVPAAAHDKTHKEKCSIDTHICIKGQMVIKAIKKKSRGLKKESVMCVHMIMYILFYLGRPGMTSIAR